MIEIRTFEGDTDELSRFAISMWRKSYEGRMLVPLWQPDFLEWELFGSDEDPRGYLVAAYDGARLVGFLPAKRVVYRLRGEEMPGTLGSYLSVDPEYRRQGIALLMHQEQERRHRERGAAINVGYLYLGSRASMGKKFWLKQPEGIVKLRKLGLWIRVLDHRAVADWGLTAFDRWGTRYLSCFQRVPQPAAAESGVRAYRPEDLQDCLRLVKKLEENTDLTYVWDERSLARQLQFKDVTRSLVLERHGRIAGLVNYCRLDLLGRNSLPAGIIDLAAFGELSFRDRRHLVWTAMGAMRAEGIKLALMLRVSCFAWPAFLATGFVPMPADQYLICAPAKPNLPLTDIRRLHIHWR